MGYQVEDDMVMKVLGQILLVCTGCIGLCSVLLKHVRPAKCYRNNTEISLLDKNKGGEFVTLKKEMERHQVVFAAHYHLNHQVGWKCA